MSDDTETQPHSAERANTFPWPPVLFGLAIVGGYVADKLFPVAWPGLDDRPAHIAGIGFGLLGVALITSAIVTLRRGGTTVMPDGVSKVLMTSGPYTWLRNPIYLGEVFILLFVAEISKNVWFVPVALLFAVLVTWLQIGPEERHLENQFGDRYRAYKDRTRRWI